ncbi:MAG: hypothetical protein IPJ20_03335 [Flammeovirgaceae bacterium]|nr:hypothetical protein [Flammeovirgaceae bacterium]
MPRGNFKSIGSSGDPKTDFNSEWDNLVAKDNKGTTKPTPDFTVEDGWTATSGVSTFQWDGKDAYILLNTISGYGKTLSITVTMNSQEFMKEVDAFLGSLDLKKPEIPATDQPTNTTQTSTPLVISNTPGNQGISMSTTNFDDGWVAQPFADYVRVTKGSTIALLHYGIEITDEMRSSGNIEGALFDRVIQPRYTVSNLRKYDNGGPCYFCIEFFEADVVEKTTGKKYYLGFRIITNSGVSQCIEIVSPSAAAFQQEFSDQKKVEAMFNYNKFAITASDLVGNWDESSGSYVDMYNTVTGSYAGMNTSSSSNSFTFNADGTYNSHHAGAFGMIGDLKVYDQKYNGEYTVTPWEITLTKQFEGKTKIYLAKYEAVRGGRVLHLTDKQSSGMQYHLVKTK